MGRRRKDSDIHSEQVHPVIIMILLRLVVGAGLCTTDVAALLGILPNTTGHHVRKHRAMQGPLSKDECEKLENAIKRLKSSLLQLHEEKLRNKKNMFEVLCFPEEKESDIHVKRLENPIDDTTSTIEMAMYVITHPRLVGALIQAQTRGVVVRVITDHTLMNCKGSLVLSLIDAGIKVWVHQRNTYMLHDRYLVLDRSIIVHGSVNWSMHAMVSSDIIMAHNDHRALRVLEAFNKLMTSTLVKTLLRDDFLASTPCVYCAKRIEAEANATNTLFRIPLVQPPEECKLDLIDGDHEMEENQCLEHSFDLDAQLAELNVGDIEFSTQEDVVMLESSEPNQHHDCADSAAPAPRSTFIAARS